MRQEKVIANLRIIAKLRAEQEGSVPHDKLLAAMDTSKLSEDKYDLFGICDAYSNIKCKLLEAQN
jgi:hypothetical protein